MTLELLTKLEDAFMNGLSDRKACEYAGINPMTLYRYQERNPKYSERKEMLKLRPDIKAQQTIVSQLGDVSTAKWWLEKKDPDFRPSSKIEHAGRVLHEAIPPSPAVLEAIKQYETTREKQIRDEARLLLRD